MSSHVVDDSLTDITTMEDIGPMIGDRFEDAGEISPLKPFACFRSRTARGKNRRGDLETR